MPVRLGTKIQGLLRPPPLNLPRSSPNALMSVVNPVRRNGLASAEWPGSMSYVGPRAEEEARRQDVGDQTLMRGLATAFPNVRPRLSLS